MKPFYKEISCMLGDESPDGAPTTEENMACLSRAVAGDDAAIDEFIIDNMRLVGGIVTKFIAVCPSSQYLADDMFAEGLLFLTESVRRLVRGARESGLPAGDYFGFKAKDCKDKINVLGYLYIVVYRNVQRHYELDSTDTISNTLRERHTPPGRNSPTRKVEIPQGMLESQTYDAFAEIFFLEQVYGACRTELETHMVDAKLRGLNKQEVAEELGVSKPTARKIERKLYRRFCRQQGLTK